MQTGIKCESTGAGTDVEIVIDKFKILWWGKDNFNFNTTNFQDIPQSYYTKKVLCEDIPELYVSIWRLLECHMHSAAKLKDPAPGIVMQPVPAKSAQQLCSALETDCEASSLPSSWMGTRVWKNTPFLSPLACCIFPKQRASGCSSSLLSESYHYLFSSSNQSLCKSHIWTNPVVWKVNNTVTPQTSWFNR